MRRGDEREKEEKIYAMGTVRESPRAMTRSCPPTASPPMSLAIASPLGATAVHSSQNALKPERTQ